MTVSIYPHGKISLTEEFKAIDVVSRYNESYSIFNRQFPVRHPALQDIVGVIPMKKAIPSFWESAVAYAPVPLRFFLMSVTAQEYYTGIGDTNRYKLFRSMLTEEEKKNVPQSPKLGGMLIGNPYFDKFNSRGSTGSEINIHITTNPQDMFFMSNGDGWSSCQHYSRGGYQERLRGSMFDCNLAMAYVLSPDKTDITTPSSIIARCLLRVAFIPGIDNKPYVLVDRDYGNDQSTQQEMVRTLLKHIELKGYNTGKLGTRSWDDYDKTYNFATYPMTRPARWDWGYNDNMSVYFENEVKVGDNKYVVGQLAGQAIAREIAE